MLILTRRLGESLLKGDNFNITVTVLDIKSGPVRIGIDAPRETAVHREEVAERIVAEKQGTARE